MEPCVYFLYLSHLLYRICVNIFIMNRYVSKSYSRSKNTIYRARAAVVSTITSLIVTFLMYSRRPISECFSLFCLSAPRSRPVILSVSIIPALGRYRSIQPRFWSVLEYCTPLYYHALPAYLSDDRAHSEARALNIPRPSIC